MTDRPTPTNRLQRLYEIAATQAGHFTTAQARSVGYSGRSLVHHTDAGHIERISRGFYRLPGVRADSHEDIVAAWLKSARRRAVVSHDTALALYDLAPSRTFEIHLTVPRKRRPRAVQASTNVRIHTTTTPLRRDELASRFSVRITPPARTIADVADLGADPIVVMEATARALATGLVSPRELSAAVKRRSARVQQLVKRAVRTAGEKEARS
jgi:predicted transcriptional regulator of viral defense system